MTDMPSKAALNLAVKPAGHTWQTFMDTVPTNYAKSIALAYAADLDKADKVGRLADSNKAGLNRIGLWHLAEAARELILSDAIDPDLLAAREMAAKAFEANGHIDTAKSLRAGE